MFIITLNEKLTKFIVTIIFTIIIAICVNSAFTKSDYDIKREKEISAMIKYLNSK